MNSFSLNSEQNKRINKNLDIVSQNNKQLTSKQKAKIILNKIKKGNNSEKIPHIQIIVNQISKISQKCSQILIQNSQQQKRCRQQLDKIEQSIQEQQKIGRKYFQKIEKFVQQLQNDYLFKFQKMNKDRLNSQIQLAKKIDAHVDKISKKSKQVTSTEQATLIKQIQEELRKIKLQIKQFFDSLSQKQNSIKYKINNRLKEFKISINELKTSDHIQCLFQDLIKIEKEITQKIRGLRNDRTHVQNNAIQCLQKMLTLIN